MSEQDPVSKIFKATAAGAGAGVFAAMMKSTWSEQQVRTMTTLSMMPALASSTKVFTDCALLFAGCGFAFSSVEEISKSVRQTDDAWNSVLGSLAAGSVLGIRFKCFKTGLGSGRNMLTPTSLIDSDVLNGWEVDAGLAAAGLSSVLRLMENGKYGLGKTSTKH